MKFIFLFFILLSACGGTGDKDLRIDSQKGNGIGIPEPSIVDQTTRFKLTKLAAVHEKFLTVNDNIVFTDLKEQMKEHKSLTEVKLKVKSHCLLNKERVLIREFTKELVPSIPLIELLPEEVLLYEGDNYPSCGFSFKAENKAGSAHHFELPQLPIMGYRENRFIKFFSSYQKINESFPYISMDSIDDYYMDLGEQKPIDNLSLICSDFDLSLPIRPQQFIPFSAFLFDQLEEKLQKKIKKQRPIQTCRIFGYVDKTLTGVSYIFYLRYSAPYLFVSIEDDLFEGKESSFYFEFMQSDGKGDKKNRQNIPLYSYSIRNSHPYPVYILIENYSKRKGKRRELLLDFYGLYYNSQIGGFYSSHEDEFYLGSIKTLRGQTAQEKTEMGTVIKLESQSEIAFSVILKKSFGLCRTRKSVNEQTYWLGGIVKYPDLKIYQLVSDKVESIPLAQNIWQQLDTKAGRGFSILTNYLTDGAEREKFDHLWFKQGICSRKIVADTNDPIIELYRSGSRVKTRWIDFTPVQQNQYRQTKIILGILTNR